MISPVLCNVYLHRLDRQWTTRGRGVLVRYADDLLAIGKTKRDAEGALEALTAILAEMGLELKQAKTRIVHLREGGEASISSASIIATCAATPPGHGISPSSSAGPHARQWDTPASASGRSRRARGYGSLSK